MMRGLLLGGMLAFFAAPVVAEPSAPRCTVLGQMALSSWLELMSALSSPAEGTVDPVIARLEQLTGTYANTGCNTARLGAAMDCLLNDSGTGNARDVARQCLQKSDLSAAE